MNTPPGPGHGAAGMASLHDDPAGLLPPRALRGLRMGISASDSDDLARLGLTRAHFKLAVRDIARTVLVGGGSLAYGARLIPGGYSEFLVGELGQYARAGLFEDGDGEPGPRLLVCLSCHEYLHTSLADLDRLDDALGLHGRVHCVDADGARIDDWRAGRPEEEQPYSTDKDLVERGMTGLRRYMASQIAGRVVLGGKRSGYHGRMPGVMEEVLLAHAAGQPFYLAGGFGGITLDMAAALDPRCEALCADGWRDALDPRARDGLAQLASVPGGFARLDNGLTEDENLLLATTHRPADVAALVALGLGRRGRSKAAQGPVMAAGERGG